MASTTVAPVESYTSDSIVPTPDNYAQFGDETQVAVNLVDSNLWLVDSSKLAAQITDTTSTVAVLDFTVASQTTVSLENITADAQPVNLATSGQTDLSQYTIPDAPLDSMLQLSAVTGGVQFGSSAGSESGSSSGLTSDGFSSLTSTSSFQSGGDGGSSVPSFGSPSGSETSSTSTTSTPDDGSGTSTDTSTGTSTDTSTGTSTGTSTSTATSTPELTSSSTSTSTSQLTPNLPPNTASNPPVPVPFDFSSSLGLTVLITIWGCKRMARFWQFQRQLKH
ncbi:MAG: hypothetical protein HY785_12785 [Oscillatoriophycideae cyanobacterium NC_groundwater_1537_Pr4_S-0.65um_50_18]|nr:hypothetical protein [Oscillatoriophycideae cyanobacterium NC_groundwater_1537_Pr4_S-0.65um_50_18]